MARSVFDNGGIIGAINTPNTSIASGIWSLNSVYDSVSNISWPGMALYAFTSFTFTNAGVTGTSGPSLAQCQSAYNTTTYPWLTNTAYFNVTNGIQLWTVPATGNYTIDAYGAAGGIGAAGATHQGAGARILGTFALAGGTKIRILVGQMGGNAAGNAGGGGGGTFVMKETGTTTADIYVIAGGGGGGAYSSYSDFAGNGSSTITASKGSGGAGGAGAGGVAGTSGNGGACYDRSGGGGGGLTGNGGSSSIGATTSGWGGNSFSNGGTAYASATYPGGFGGGGSGDWNTWTGGGGGGGYNGGGGGYYYGGGGGGGSYNNGTNQTNTAGARVNNHGQVIITRI